MCADSITANYQWIKPQVGASPTTWGNKINDDLDQIDADLFTVATGVIGAIMMYGGATAPTDWLLCDGTVYQNTDIPLLAPVLNNAFGGEVDVSNAVPDLRQAFPIGAQIGVLAVGATGGEAAHTLVAAELPTDAYEDAGHTHAITDNGHTHQVDVANYELDVGGGADTLTTIAGGGWQTGTENSPTGVVINTGSADIVNTGGGGAHNNLPPFVCLSFIIKYQ